MSSAKRFGMALLLIVALGGTAQAVSLGKIEVASHLGEPFFAEVPLILQEDESLTSVFVELASPAEYRILEIYRDPALNAIRSDIESDARGPRVKLTSDGAIDAPFFNLVLKLRYGRATHFKKFPIFLDLPPATLAPAKPKPVVAEQPPAKVATETTGKEAGFTPFSGWARTSRYGPMVYGDTLATVARRLRVDKRYTLPQVMVALFEKNRSKFDKDNMNLIKAGTYLDVPTAAEVEAHSPVEASSIIREHERQWNALKQQPQYAAVAEAQKHRYSKRVRVAKMAVGEAGKPAPTAAKAAPAPAGAGEAAAGAAAETKGEAAATTVATETAGGEAAALSALKEENALLKERLQQAEDKIATLASKSSEAELAAAAQRIKRLELSLARLRTELDQARQQSGEPAAMQSWMNYGLMGAVVLLLMVIAYLLRRERTHPAAETAAAATAAPTAEQEVAAPAPELAAAGVAAGEPETAAAEPEMAEEELVPELTEKDTAEMQAFAEGEEEPDPNVDYLAEADVYLRYGMEDEALRHVRLAVRQRPDNADAHAKLVHLLQSRGDQEGAEKAIAAARAALSGEALAQFERQIEGESAEPSAAAGGAEPQTVAGEEETVVTEEEEALDLGAVSEEGEAETEEAGGEAAAEAIDLSDIEWSEGESVAEAKVEKAAETEEAGAEEEGAAEEALDLSDIELPQAEGGEEAELAPDLEATVVLDRSQEIAAEEETAVGEEAGREGAEKEAAAEGEGLDFDLSELELPQAEGEMNEPSEAPGEEAAAAEKEEEEGLDIDLSSGMELPQEVAAAAPTAAETEEEAVEVAEESPEEEGMLDLDLEIESGGEATAEAGEAAEETAEDELAELHAELEAGSEQAQIEEQAVGTKHEEEVAEVDLSQELDELLSELDAEGGEATELSPATLAIDTGKSLLAEGQLDEAQRAFNDALESDVRSQALLGLAEVALQRGEKDKAQQMLAEAEAILDASSQEWFARLQGQLQP